ncbi:MAG: phosphoribosyltransferase family protein, partial [Candidatus Micrarchaeia archaeon]
MARLKRGFDRQALSDRQVKILSKRLAGKVRLSGFHPTLIVGIKHGGTVVGKAVAEELNVPFKEVFVKRVPAIYIDKIVHGYPRAFKNKIVSKIARSVISKTYLLFKPRTISPLKEGLSVQDRVLVVDDSAGKGPTSQEAKRHVVERGALPKNVKIGVLQIHPEYKIKERPDYFLEVGNARFPWDKASIVQSGKNPRESFKRLKKGKTRLLVLKDSAKALLDKEIEKPDLFVEKALGPKTYYGRPDSMVVGLKVPGVNRVVVKKFKRSRAATLGKVLPELLGYWGRLPENAVRMGQEFLKRGVLTPQPVALVENRVWGFWKKSFLVAEEVPEAITLSRFLRQEKDPKKQREMIRLVAKATKKMHDEGLTHG